jgi:hypothetical protein
MKLNTKAIQIVCSEDLNKSLLLLSKDLGIAKSATIRNILSQYLIAKGFLNDSKIPEYYI